MTSKAEIKIASSLGQKKYRRQHGLFLAEGPKVVSELYQAGFELQQCYAAEPPDFEIPFQKVGPAQLGRMSQLKNPNNCLALFRLPTISEPSLKGLIVALDGVRDPGNMGTIIRLCDWFGVEQILCSNDTVDCYNPKVVQASMGSLARVKVFYGDLGNIVSGSPLKVYAAMMEGDSIYDVVLPTEGILLMGNEGSGISAELLKAIDNHVSIPRFGRLRQTESLNVAMATAILLSEFRRPTGK